MIRSILVPLDGSTFGEQALPMAACLACKTGATLHLVHVHQMVPAASLAGFAVLPDLDSHLRQDEQAYLTEIVWRLSEKVSLPMHKAILDGDVVKALQRYAESQSVDLIVMSTHGRGALGRFWLGSIADVLVRSLPRPVLLVRQGEGPAEQAKSDLKTILLPLDGTPLAEQVIEPALDLGGPCGATFTLVRVNKPAPRSNYLPPGGLRGLTSSAQEPMPSQQAQANEEAQEYLERIATPLKTRGYIVHSRVLVNEDPAAGIVLEAQEEHADLIAMETHGRRGISRLLLGSIADKIVCASPVPVLLNRPVV